MPLPINSRRFIEDDQPVLPVNLLNTPHTLVEDFETSTDFTVSGGTAEADTTNFISGSQSIKVTTDAGAAGYINKKATYDFSAVETFRIRLYIPDETKISAMAILMSHSASNYTNGFQYSISVGNTRNGWSVVEIPKASWSLLGAGTWASPFLQIRFRCTGATGEQGVVSWDMFTAGVKGTPAVCIIFDDGFGGVYDYAFPTMHAYGLRGTVGVISSLIGSAGHMTAAQLQQMYEDGWDLANHSDDSDDLTTLSQADAQTAIETCKAVLDGYGWTRASNILIYPSGGYNATVWAAAQAAGMVHGYAVAEGGYESMPFENQWAILRTKSLSDASDLANVETNAANALTTRGNIWFVYGHQIVSGAPSGLEWNSADFASLCAYLSTLHPYCVTVSDLYKLQSGAVRVPRTRFR